MMYPKINSEAAEGRDAIPAGSQLRGGHVNRGGVAVLCDRGRRCVLLVKGQETDQRHEGAKALKKAVGGDEGSVAEFGTAVGGIACRATHEVEPGTRNGHIEMLIHL